MDSEFIYALIPRDTFAVRFIKRRMMRDYGEQFNEYLLRFQDEHKYWWPIVYSNNLLVNILDHVFPSFKSLWQVRALEKILEQKKPNLIHVHWTYPAGFIVSQLSQKYEIPYVLTAHGSDIHSVVKRNRPSALKALEKAAKCIFVSRALQEQAIYMGYSGENAVVIPNGYDPTCFYPGKKENAKTELGFENRYLVGFVGNLVEVKNAQILPELFLRIHEANNQVDFVIIGDGPLKPELSREFAEFHLDVKFTGNISPQDVGHYMRAMDVLAVPSQKEGWGCVITEAHACGTYVVGSNRGGIPEAIGSLGKTFSLEDNFTRKCASHIAHILEVGYNSLELVNRASSFKWSNIVQQEIDLYRSIVGTS